LALHSRRRRRKLNMFYKIRNNNAPSYLCDSLLPFERNENAYNLRNIKKLSRLWVIITLILQNQLTFCTGFWGSRTWKLDNIKLVQEEFEDLD
jgi:hypothetical protein